MEVIKVKDLIKANDHFKEMLKNDPEFKKAWEEIEPEYELARQIIKRRKELNITQEELAEMLNTTQSVISRLENGHNCTLSWIKKVSKPLKCKPKIILEPTDSPDDTLVKH